MGTRSLTVVQENGKDICVLYRQYDGYPEGHGMELCKFLEGMTITNGIGGSNTANGMGCLAAQIVANFKQDIGQFYLYPSGTRNVGEEYIYIIQDKNHTPYVKVYDEPWDVNWEHLTLAELAAIKPVMQGTPEEILELIKEEA